MSALRRWLLVALAFVEVLTASGIMFGWSAITLALQREGVYRELCPGNTNSTSTCDAQVLRLNVVYGVSATAMPLSMFIWGPAMDHWGTRRVRLAGLLLFVTGALLFALARWSAQTVVDCYTIAGALVSSGGAGFFLSHFVIAEHFRGSHFGLVHTLLNGAFDSSTVTMVMLEGAHAAGLSLRGCFLCLAGLGVVYMALTTDVVWRGMLMPPQDAATPDLAVPDLAVGEDGGGPREEDKDGPSAQSGTRPQYGPAMDKSHLRVAQQLRSPHFVAVAVWALVAVFEATFVLGSIGPQMQYNGGGRDSSRVDQLVRSFNWLILCSAPAGPAFGRLLDRFGPAAGFCTVNVLGILSYLGLALCETSAEGESALLSLSFVAYGLFRAFNYASITAYVQGVFGHTSFGTLYGIGIGLVAVFAAAAVSPVTAWAIGSVADGKWDSFAPVDLGIVFTSIGLFSFPGWIVWATRSGRACKCYTAHGRRVPKWDSRSGSESFSGVA